MSTALAKPSEQLVMDLINEKSNERISFNEVVFGAPLPNSNPSYGRNTTMMVNSLPGKAIGTKTVYYNRLDLTLLFTNSGIDEVTLTRPEQFTSILQLLPELNSLYGLALSANDIHDAQPASGNTQVLTVRNSSYAYLGNLQVTISAGGKPPIGEVIFLNTMEALDYMNADVTGLIAPIVDLQPLEGPLAIEAGSLRLHSGYTPNKYWVGENGEVTAGISVRAQQGTTQTEPVVQPNNSLALQLNGGTTQLMVSLELTQRAGLPADVHGLDSRYEIQLFLRSTAPAAPADVILRLIRTGGVFQWVKADGTAVTPTEAIDGPGSTAHLLHQARFDLSQVFPEMAFDGEFIAGLSLHRKATLAARVYLPMVFNVN